MHESTPLEAVFHHVAIAVRDMDRMLAFYRDLLGFALEWEKPSYDGRSFAKVVALDGARAHVAMLNGHGMHIELFHYLEPQGRSLGELRMCDFGYTHFGMKVKDLHAIYARLHEAGTPFNSPPENLRPGVWAAYFKDPEGNTIEIVEYADNPPS